MGRSILTLLSLLCVWKCCMINAQLTDKEVHTAMNYISKTFSIPMFNVNDADKKHYSFVAVLTDDECKKLSGDAKNVQFLRREKAADIANTLNDDCAVYEGSQMVLAVVKKRRNANATLREDKHSVFRLLYPQPGSKVSPVESLLSKNPKAQCVFFYSYNSPCVGSCINPNITVHPGPITMYATFRKVPKRAFVYSTVYEKNDAGEPVTKESIWAGLGEMKNRDLHVYRCLPDRCFYCLQNIKEKFINEASCMN